jgi:hypothetical protein
MQIPPMPRSQPPPLPPKPTSQQMPKKEEEPSSTLPEDREVSLMELVSKEDPSSLYTGMIKVGEG